MLKIISYMNRRLISRLLEIFFVFLFSTNANAEWTSWKIRDGIAGKIESKAKEKNAVTFSTAQAISYIEKKGSLSNYQDLQWSKVSNYYVLHCPNENLNGLIELANRNQVEISKTKEVEAEYQGPIEFSLAGVALNVTISSFRKVCRVDWIPNYKDKTSIYSHSDSAVSSKEYCNILAWTYAANEIEVISSEEKGKVLLQHKVRL